MRSSSFWWRRVLRLLRCLRRSRGPQIFQFDGSVAFFKSGESNPTQPDPPPPSPPLGAFGQQLVAEGVALRRPRAPKAPDAP